MKRNKSLEGLEGWLILIAILIISRPLLILLQSFPLHVDSLSGMGWSEHMLPDKAGYYLIWKRLVVCEMMFNIILFAASIYSISLFFSKRKIFPRWYIGLIVSKLALTLITMQMKKHFIPDTFSYSHTHFVFYRYLIEVAIGVPYMLFSKRVKATFVRN